MFCLPLNYPSMSEKEKAEYCGERFPVQLAFECVLLDQRCDLYLHHLYLRNYNNARYFNISEDERKNLPLIEKRNLVKAILESNLSDPPDVPDEHKETIRHFLEWARTKNRRVRSIYNMNELLFEYLGIDPDKFAREKFEAFCNKY